MIRRLGLALLLALGMAVVPAAAAQAAPAAPTGPAEDIAALVNQARWSNGQAGLIRNSAMDQVAANWAATMAANEDLSHNPNYSSEIPGGWVAAAENVAQGYPTGASMHDGWMNSGGHRANILGDYTDIGIAFLSSGGTTWGVQVFANYPGHVGPANPNPPPPPAPAPAPAEPAPAAPAEEAAATPTPTPGATITATRTPTPEPSTPGATEVVEFTRDDPGTPLSGWWIAVPVGAALLVAATILTIRRRLGLRRG